MIKTDLCLSVFCVLAICCTFETRSFGQQAARSSEQGTVEEVLDTWKEREEALTSASFSWKIDRAGFRRWSTYQTEYFCADQPTASSVDRAHDVQSLYLRGDKIRGEMWRWRPLDYQEFVGFASDSTGPGAATRNAYFSAWKARFAENVVQEYGPYRYVTFFDGRERFDVHEGHSGRPIVFRSPSCRNEQGGYPYLNDVLCQPALLACRPIHWKGVPITAEDIRILPQKSAVQGESCDVIELRLADRETVTMWLDTARDFHVLRAIHCEGGKERYQLDISYQEDRDLGWIPRHWTAVVLNDRCLTPGRSDTIQFASCTMTEASLDEDFPDSLFRANLPRGAYVVNTATGSASEVTGNGTTRELRKDEVASVRGSLEITSVEDVERSVVKWYQLVGLAVLMLAVVVLRRSRRKLGGFEVDASDGNPCPPNDDWTFANSRLVLKKQEVWR